MPGCILRVRGRTFDAIGFLRASALRPCAVFRAGEPLVPGASRRSEANGFNVVGSEAGGADLERQVARAEAFLAEHQRDLERLMRSPGVEGACLDFGVWSRLDHAAIQCDVFPASLVRPAAALGLSLELSVDPPDAEPEV